MRQISNSRAKKSKAYLLPARAVAGFTLIEMMIVVVIVAILAAIAIPIYQTQIMESRRTSAKSALLDIAGREEKYYSTNNTYTMELSDLGYTQVTSNEIQVPGNGTNYYNVAINSNPASASTSASTFIVTASPYPNSSQQNDTGCNAYSITDMGVESNNGTQTTGCW